MTMAPGQLFDPATYNPSQAAALTNSPGQSLGSTNAPDLLTSAGAYTPNIPVTKIAPADSLNLSSGQNATDYKSILAGTNISLPTPVDTSAEEAAVKGTQDKITSDLTSLGDQSAFQASQEDASGVTADKKSLSDLQNQLLSVNNEAQISNLNIDRVGRPAVLTVEADIEHANVERDRTIKALGLSSSIQAMQGNLALANDQVSRAVALKYDPIKAELTTLNNQLDYNYKNLSAKQQEQADQIKAENDLKMKLVDIQVENDKLWSSNKNTALANGAPIALVNQAEQLQQGGDENSARALLAPYTGTKNYNGTGTGTTTENAAVNLYGNMIGDQLTQGRTPEQAVQVAVAAASALGTNLTLKEQNALLNYARGYKITPVSTTTQNTSTPTGGLDQKTQDILNSGKITNLINPPKPGRGTVFTNSLPTNTTIPTPLSNPDNIKLNDKQSSNVINGIGSFFSNLF